MLAVDSDSDSDSYSFIVELVRLQKGHMNDVLGGLSPYSDSKDD